MREGATICQSSRTITFHLLRASTIVLFAVIPWCVTGEEPTTKPAINLWKEVKARADKSTDSKTLWRELKKLSPTELLICGEQFATDAEKTSKTMDGDGLIITVNAILHYHQTKVGYDRTAEEVGKAIAESEHPLWVLAAIQWIENNRHYSQISEKGFQAIANGFKQSLDNPKRNKGAQMFVIQKTSSSKIASKYAESRPGLYSRKMPQPCRQLPRRPDQETGGTARSIFGDRKEANPKGDRNARHVEGASRTHPQNAARFPH